MLTLDEFSKFANDVSSKFGFEVDKLHEHILSLKIPGRLEEVARMIYLETEQTIGVQFQIELVNSDAIQIFSICKHYNSEITLLQSFYQNQRGETFTGVDAQIMLEHDRENKIVEALSARERAQQEEEFQIKKMEKNGKITFH